MGLDNAGKTTILYQFLMNEVVHTSPTIGSNVEEVVWKNIHFIMWDLGGQQSLRAAWSTYYSNTEVSSISFRQFDVSLSFNRQAFNYFVSPLYEQCYQLKTRSISTLVETLLCCVNIVSLENISDQFITMLVN